MSIVSQQIRVPQVPVVAPTALAQPAGSSACHRVVPTFHFALQEYPNSGKPYLEIAELARVIAGRTAAEVVEQPGCVDFAPNENPVQGLDCTRTRERLGWRPQCDLLASIDRLVHFYRLDNGARQAFIQDQVDEAISRVEELPAAKCLEWYRGRRVLVTGAAGFKGAYLCALLQRLGAEVHGAVHRRSHPEGAYMLLRLSEVIEEVQFDVADRDSVKDVLNQVRPQAVIHAAAVSTVTAAIGDPARAFAVNACGPVYLLDAARQVGGVERVLIMSTDHVFGDVPADQIPLPEGTPIGFNGPYDTSKACGEIAVRSMVATYGRELPLVCITRAANVFGPGDTAQRRVIPAFIRKGREEGIIPLTCRKNGRQFIAVEDVCWGYLLALARLG